MGTREGTNDGKHSISIEKEEKWDKWFLGLAKYVSTASKDPSTKVGAVIVDSRNRVVSMGYNGFPQKTTDKPELLNDREAKLKRVLHAEANAILFAKQDLTDCTIYTWPFGPCSNCASFIIQSGITRVVYVAPNESIKARWAESIAVSDDMFKDAGIETKEYDCEI